MEYTARAIVEVVGSPQEHIKTVIATVQEHLKKEENIKIVSTETSDVEKMPEGELFSGFIDIELKVKDLARLSQFCVDYMPASLEVVDVDKITLSAQELNNVYNDFLSKLHQYNLALFNAVNQAKKK